MPGLRDLLVVVLGAVLGVALLAAPRAALRLSVFGGRARRRGDYGTDGTVPDRWAWLVRGLGVACLAVTAYIASQTVL